MKLSICLATYNGEKFIKRQLDSILPYLDSNDEIIISDDSSTDNTIKIIEQFEDSRIRIFREKKFRNPIFNFEFALKQAKHELIFLCDQDDIWFPEKIPTVKKLLEEYDLIVTDCIVTNENLQVIHNSFFEYIQVKTGLFNNLLRNRYIGTCMAFNVNILQKALPFPQKIPMHDWWIGLVAEYYGKVYLLKKPMMYYIRHDNNASNTGFKSQRSLGKKIMLRIYLLKGLIFRIFNNKLKKL